MEPLLSHDWIQFSKYLPLYIGKRTKRLKFVFVLKNFTNLSDSMDTNKFVSQFVLGQVFKEKFLLYNDFSFTFPLKS